MLRKARYTFYGATRSEGARDAEDRGLLPLTRAIRAFAQEAGITQKEARRLLLEMGADEWHHTGLYARRTDYYNWRWCMWLLNNHASDDLNHTGSTAPTTEGGSHP